MSLHVQLKLPLYHKVPFTFSTSENLQSKAGVSSPGQVATLLHLVDDRPPQTGELLGAGQTGELVLLFLLLLDRDRTSVVDHLVPVSQDFATITALGRIVPGGKCVNGLFTFLKLSQDQDEASLGLSTGMLCQLNSLGHHSLAPADSCEAGITIFKHFVTSNSYLKCHVKCHGGGGGGG